jgi:hypothetical protein
MKIKNSWYITQGLPTFRSTKLCLQDKAIEEEARSNLKMTSLQNF